MNTCKKPQAERNKNLGNSPLFLVSEVQSIPKWYSEDTEYIDRFEIYLYSEYESFVSKSFNKVLLVPLFFLQNNIKKPQNGLLISFKRECIEEDDKEFSLDVFNLFNGEGQYREIQLTEDTQINLCQILKLMQYEFNYKQGNFLVIKSLLKVFLLHLIRLSQNIFLEQDINQKRVYDFMMLLDKNFINERNTSFYAKELGISSKRLNQILQEKINTTVTHLIHDRLLLEARRRLIVSNFTIKEIAYQLNFKDNSYFSRFFRKHTGLTPENYRNTIKKND